MMTPDRNDFSVTFSNEGEFAAYRAAEAWLTARGFSVAPMQAGAPTGFLFGDYKIAKWRGLDSEERNDLHGAIRSKDLRYRHGPVTVELRKNVHSSVLAAFRSDPEPGDAMIVAHPDLAARLHVEGKQVDPVSGGITG